MLDVVMNGFEDDSAVGGANVNREDLGRALGT